MPICIHVPFSRKKHQIGWYRPPETTHRGVIGRHEDFYVQHFMMVWITVFQKKLKDKIVQWIIFQMRAITIFYNKPFFRFLKKHRSDDLSITLYNYWIHENHQKKRFSCDICLELYDSPAIWANIEALINWLAIGWSRPTTSFGMRVCTHQQQS